MAELQGLLQEVLNHPLGNYDARFSEERALQTAAGTFVFGVKSGLAETDSQVIPGDLLDIWKTMPELQQRFPDPLNLGVADNLMLWAKTEGRAHSAVATCIDSGQPFLKHKTADTSAVAQFNSWPVIEPKFATIGEVDRRQAGRVAPDTYGLFRKGLRTIADEGVSGFMRQVQKYVRWRLNK